jgi:hypothetical protein
MKQIKEKETAAGSHDAERREVHYPRFFGEGQDREARHSRRRHPPARNPRPSPDNTGADTGDAAADMPRFIGETDN